MDDIEDANTSGSGPAPATTVTIKAVYCPGSNQEEIRRFNFQLPAACADDGGGGDAQLFDEFRRRISAACSAAGDSLSLYYMDADQERVRFSTGEELRQLLRLRGQAAAPLRILAEPSAAGGDADGVDHPGVLCDGCNQGIRGRRFRCFLCPDYDLCQQCVLRGVHDQHSMLVLHRPGDADSLPPWLCRGGLGRGGGGGRWGGPGSWMWPGAVGRHFPWQQQQQQQMPGAPPPFTRPTMPHMPPHGPHHPHHVPHMQMPPPPPPPPMPPLSVACPKLARKVEKARCRFEAKLAKRCDRVQRRWVRRQQKQCQKLHQKQQQQQQQQDPAAPGTADQPIRIDGDDQLQQQQQQQQFSPEEALLLKQLRKRHKQSAAAAAGKKQKPKKSHHHRHHHKKSSRGGRKRRRSGSSSSSSSSSSTSSSASSSSSGSSSDSEGESDAETAQEKAYRQLLKKFKKMGFKDDDTCWLRELIREKRGNLNDIIDAIQQRKQQQQQQGACGGRDV